MNEQLGAMGIPGMKPNQYSKNEQQIGQWWREVPQDDMKDAGKEEKEHAIQVSSFHAGVPAVAVVCEGGWCKRSSEGLNEDIKNCGRHVLGIHDKCSTDLQKHFNPN